MKDMEIIAGWTVELNKAYADFLDVCRLESQDAASTGFRSAMALDRVKRISSKIAKSLILMGPEYAALMPKIL